MVDINTKKTEAAEWLEHFLTVDLLKEDDISYNKLVKKIMIGMGVPDTWVDKHIRRFYVDEGLVLIENNVIKAIKQGGNNGNNKK